MYYCKIEGGLVVDRIVFDEQMPLDWPDRESWIESSVAQIGWVFSSGVLIDPYVPPPPASPYRDLKPYQFWGAVRATGHEQALRDWVAAIEDPVQQGIASAMLEYSLEFRRDHPLIEAARLHLEMSETELNDLWLWGLTL